MTGTWHLDKKHCPSGVSEKHEVDVKRRGSGGGNIDSDLHFMLVQLMPSARIRCTLLQSPPKVLLLLSFREGPKALSDRFVCGGAGSRWSVQPPSGVIFLCYAIVLVRVCVNSSLSIYLSVSLCVLLCMALLCTSVVCARQRACQWRVCRPLVLVSRLRTRLAPPSADPQHLLRPAMHFRFRVSGFTQRGTKRRNEQV